MICQGGTMTKSREGQSQITYLFSRILHWIEFFIALVSIVFVFLGIFQLITEIPNFQSAIGEHGVQQGFKDILADILLLVVGIELAIMLIRRTPESLVEVMFFVIARKMLIQSDGTFDLLIGVAALAGLFAVRKYLEQKPLQ